MSRAPHFAPVRPVVPVGLSTVLVVCVFVLGALVAPATASADVSVFEILINRDQNPTTGCDVTTVDGVFEGVEQILTTTVETDPTSGTVTGVERRECTGAVFGAPIPVDAGGWDVGVGLGQDGSDVIETYLPLSALASGPEAIRLGVASMDEDMDEDALLTADGADGGPPIVLVLVQESVLDIPTSSEWGLLLLALLLAASSLLVLRHRNATASLLAVVLLVGSAGVLWAGTLDGDPSEWNAGDLLAEDAAFDAAEGADIVALYGMVDGSEICLRIDAHLQFPPANTAPTAVDDAYATDEDTVLAVPASGVLSNDTDPDSDPLTVTDHDPVSAEGAVVTVAADGSFTYDPTGVASLQALDDGESMDDTFSYTVSDGTVTDMATVTVTVSGVNDAPTAMDDTYETDEDTLLTIMAPGVLVNDGDVDTSDSLTAVLDTTTANGSLTLNADGSFTYMPAMDFNGVDTFTYRASDGTTTSALATATITVGPVNDGPNAVDDSFMTDEDTVLSEMAPGVLTNDTDPEMDPISVTAFDAASAQGADVTVNADGSFTYDPTVSAALQALDDGEMVDDTFTYTIDDGSANPDTATVTITVTGANDAPVAADDAYATDEDTALNVPAPGVLGNDTDVDVEALTAVLVAGPSNSAAFMLDADGSFSYTPAMNFNGSDSFTYRASDGTVTSNVATVTITVNAVNDPPVADDETFAAVCNVESVVEMGDQTAEPAGAVFRAVADNVLVGDSDPVEMDTVSIVSATGMATDSTGPEYTVTTAQGGTVTLHPDGSFTYTPEGGDRSVADSFQYTIQDVGGAQATATVTLNVGSACVWFVDNAGRPGADDDGTGTSSDPFASLVDEEGPDALPDDAEDAALAGDVVYVFEGGDGYEGDYTALANQRVLGQGVDLVVDLGGGDETLFTGNPANRPLVDASDDGFTASDVTGVEIAGFEIDAVDHAFTASSGAAPVGVLFRDNVITGAGNEAIDLTQGAAGDSLVVLMDNTVTATANAIQATTTAGNLELAIDGNTDITSAANAIELTNGGGNLYVSSLCGNSIHGDTVGAGLVATGVTFDADPSDADFTGDEVECATGNTVGSMANPVGGAGVVLTGVTGDLDLGSLDVFAGTAAGADEPALQVIGSGIFNAGAGTGFQLTTDSGTLNSIDGPAVDIDPVSLENVVLTALSSQNSNTVGVGLTDVSGSFTVTGTTTVGSAGGDGVAITDSAVGVTFTGQVAISGAGGEGISLDDLVGDFSAADATSSITGTTGDAFNSLSSEGNITYAGTITNTSNNSVDIRNHGSAGAATTIAFSGNVDDDGAGIFLTNNDQGMGATVNFTGGLDLDTGINEAFVATEGGTVNVTSGAVSTTADTTTGTLVRIINTTIGGSGVFFDSTSKTGGADGILLTQAGAGNFTTNGGSILNQTDRAFDVSGGSGDLTVAANLSTTATGRTVEVTTHTGGTANFSGTITDPGLGIRLANNVGATLNFPGQLDLDTTTNNAFDATGGGTVNVTAAGNDVDTTTGIGVNIVNTTIGGDDVTFESVSANGGTNGIVLDTTGTTGSFSVTGDGSTAGSGGTIQNMTGANGSSSGIGIRLNQARDTTFRFLQLNDFSNFAIRGTTVTNFTLTDTTISGTNGDSAADDEGSVSFDNLLGSAAFTDNVISGGHEDNIVVTNDTGTLNRMTVSGGTVGLNSTLQGNDGILVEAQNDATVNFTVDGVTFLGSRGDHIQSNALGTSDMDVVIRDNTFQNAHTNSLGGGVTISGGGAGTNIDVTYDVSGTGVNTQTFRDSVSSAITVNPVNGAGSVVGTVSNNKIGVSGVAGSGSSGGGAGIAIGCGGSLTHTSTVDTNDIDRVNGTTGAIDLNTQSSCSLNATVTNNTVDELDGFTFAALYTFSGGASAADTATICADIRNNTLDGSASFGFDLFVDQLAGSAASYNFPGYAGPMTGGAALDAFLSGQNTLVQPLIDTSSAQNVTGNGASCP